MRSSWHRIIGLLLYFVPLSGNADWINLSGAENSRNIAEIYVEEDHVRIQLEIFIEDLPVFKELIPDSFFPEPVPNRPSLKERQVIFANHVLRIVTDKGEQLPVQFKTVDKRLRVPRPSPFVGLINPFTNQKIAGPPDDKRVIYAELIYPFTKQPVSLQFFPPTDENGLLRTVIGFTCYHKDVQVVDFRLLGQNQLMLDWDDPWYSEFEANGLKRNIGSGLRTFLYIEPYEVRNEILVRVKDMMAWMDFQLIGNDYIEIDEFDRVREQIGTFFLERENVVIDGKRYKAILDRVAFVESSMSRSRFIEVPERIPLNSAMVGVIITYLHEGIPEEVTTEWTLFSDRIQTVTARMTDPAGPFPWNLDHEDNVLQWNNHLVNYNLPTIEKIEVAQVSIGYTVTFILSLIFLLSLLTIIYTRYKSGRPSANYIILSVALSICIIGLFFFRNPFRQSIPLEEDKGSEIIQSLLSNVYRSFDFRNESDIYDKLALSIEGNLLTRVYLDHQKSMVIQQAGGASAKVEEVEIESLDISNSKTYNDALELHTVWTALGTVGHWGHIHTRQNRYNAIITIKVIDGYWRIVDMDMLEEIRIDPFGQV